MFYITTMTKAHAAKCRIFARRTPEQTSTRFFCILCICILWQFFSQGLLSVLSAVVVITLCDALLQR